MMSRNVEGVGSVRMMSFNAQGVDSDDVSLTPKALANFSPGLELATTLGSEKERLMNAESVRHVRKELLQSSKENGDELSQG
jgi:hypothetical protein